MARPSNGPAAFTFRTVLRSVKRKAERILLSRLRVQIEWSKRARSFAKIQSKMKVSQVMAGDPLGGRFRTAQNLRKQSRMAALTQALREFATGGDATFGNAAALSVQSL
jgi:hypothetical protein